MPAPTPASRAPRLRPDQRIAAHVTRVGRFRRIDPAKTRRLPTFWALLGRLGWAVLVEESFRRARRRAGAPKPAGPDAPETATAGEATPRAD